MKNKIEVLDVTLRDGGCVNNFNFGSSYISQIVCALEESNVNIIELGYIDEKEGTASGRTKYDSIDAISSNVLTRKKPGTLYLAMIDYGKYDVRKLPPRSGKTIDGIRLAFHKKDRKAMLQTGRIILDKGYQLFVQPMLTLHYTENELQDLISDIKSSLSESTAFYIVDSFGEMRPHELSRIVEIVDRAVPASIKIGFHSHNNLQLSYALAISLITKSIDHALILDASIMGMGKGAGNLCTELLLDHLNIFTSSTYNIIPLLRIIDKVIRILHQETPWGYSTEFYLSSINHCSPSYASYFYNKQMLAIDQVGELLSKISPKKAISFDRSYAEELYYKYHSEISFDDISSIQNLGESITGNEVLLIAPGKSIATHEQQIQTFLSNPKIVSISLNNNKFITNYILITRPDFLVDSSSPLKSKVIITSRLANTPIDNALIIDYYKWTTHSSRVHDSSAIIALNLLKRLKASRVYLAGFDGFSPDINCNYFDPAMRRTIIPSQANMRNKLYKDAIAEFNAQIPISFVTPSIYQLPKEPSY